MYHRFYIKIVIFLLSIVILSFISAWLLISNISLTLFLVNVIVILFISVLIIRLIRRVNQQISFFFESIKHADFTNNYSIRGIDPLLQDMYKEMNRITTLFSEQEKQSMENQNYYEGLLRVMAHEIRNTIAPVTTLATDMEQKYELYHSDEIKKGLQIIQSQGKALLNLLDAYHRLTHLPDPVYNVFPVEDIFQKLQRLLTAENYTGRVEYRIENLKTIYGDPNLILLALLNLVKNALQAIDGNPEGRVSLIGRQSGTNSIIQIIDNGYGIPFNLQKEIFTPFYSTKQEGSGIGLSISYRIMQLHHGALTVESDPGRGASFSLLFTLRPE